METITSSAPARNVKLFAGRVTSLNPSQKRKSIDGARKFITWPDTTEHGKARSRSVANVEQFFYEMHRTLRYNTFDVGIELDGNRLNDLTLKALCFEANKLGLPDRLPVFADLVQVVAARRSYHPVREYLSGLKWDGTSRLAKWLPKYMGSKDNALTRAFGQAALLGAVHRVLYPGCKFDLMLTLIGPQGNLKSSSLSVLGGEWFSDSVELGLGPKEMAEQTGGKWIVEVPELAGLQASKVEQIKSQLSRQTDRARPAYGRIANDYPRQFILIGTTNAMRFLKDPTGNRRFMPVMTGKIDLKALKLDRDQLWAEAYQLVKNGVQPTIPEELWKVAAAEQEAHREVTPWEEKITEMVGDAEGKIVKNDLWEALGVSEPERQNQRLANSMTDAMRRLGWEVDRQRRKGLLTYCYKKGERDEWLMKTGGIFSPVPKPQGQFLQKDTVQKGETRNRGAS